MIRIIKMKWIILEIKQMKLIKLTLKKCKYWITKMKIWKLQKSKVLFRNITIN